MPDNYCGLGEGTLGSLVQDQNGVQYVLSDGHVIELGPYGYLQSGLPRNDTYQEGHRSGKERCDHWLH